MAQDRPTASELLAAIADFLREEATPVLDRAEPRLAFQMRVAAEFARHPRARGQARSGRRRARARTAGAVAGPRRHAGRAQPRACAAARTGERDERDPALMAHLDATIADKIAIANPEVEVMMPATFFQTAAKPDACWRPS